MASALKRPAMGGDIATPYPDGGYGARLNSSLATKHAEMPVPATDYATTRSALSDRQPFEHQPITYRDSAIVSRIPRMLGLLFNWSWGGVDQGANTGSLPQPGNNGLTGLVNSTQFQRILVQLHDWQLNRRWYIAYPMAGAVFQGGNAVRGTYPSFRAEQISANVTGGVGPGRMQPRPRFSAVQKIAKYNTTPRFYGTTSAMGKGRGNGGYSTLNGPGV